MSPPQVGGLVHSVQERLRNKAQEEGRPFAELLELYAIERFLHRLGRSQFRDRLVLKGALLLRQWLGAETRPTRDIDLLGPEDLREEGLRAILGDLLRIQVEEDGIEFDLETIIVRPIRGEANFAGLRAKFDARLGQARVRYQVDVGLGDEVFPPPVEIVPGGLLGLPVASLRAYTPYTSVAEKLEAMVLLGGSNSRSKDYYDLLQIPRSIEFDGAPLRESIHRTFTRRSTAIPAEPLEGLADEFATEPVNVNRWRAFLGKSRLRVKDVDLLSVVRSIREFAQPVLDAAREDRPFRGYWPRGGPWHPEVSEKN